MEKLTKLLLFLYLLVFPFGQLAKLPIDFFGPEVRVYLGDVLVGLAVGIWGVGRVKRGKKVKKEKKTRQNLAFPILVFVGVAALSLLVNIPRLASGEALVASFYLLRWIIYAGLYFVVRDITKTKNIDLFSQLTIHNPLLTFLLLAGGLTATFGLLQYFWFPDLRTWLESRHWDPHYFRVYGTFFDPGYFGMIMVLTLIPVVIRMFSRHSYQSKFILYTLYSILYTALALTYSRSSYLAYLVGMGIIAWKLKKPKFYAGVLAIFAITLFVLPRPGGEGVRLEREESIKARIINWKQSLTIAKDHPILGVGFNAYRYAQRDYGFLDEENWQESHAGAGADSSLLFVLATTGVVGVITYLWFLKKVLDLSGLVVLASICVLLVHSLFLNSLFYPWIMGWIWILLGIGEKVELKSRLW